MKMPFYIPCRTRVGFGCNHLDRNNNACQDRDNVIDTNMKGYNDKAQKIKNASMQTKTTGQKYRQKERYICMYEQGQ